MLMNSGLVLVVLGTTTLALCRCEGEDVHGSGFGFDAGAGRVAVLQPLYDYDCVESVVCRFKLDGHLYQVIDLQCDRRIDYVLRDDGLVLMVLPPFEQERRPAPPVPEEEGWPDFNPETDIIWSKVIDDGRPSPFRWADPHRWLHEHGLVGLQEGDVLSQVIHVDEYSVDAWTADVTVISTSRLSMPDIHQHGLEYQWYAAEDVETGIDCWSIRIRGDLTSVLRWLVEAGFFELHMSRGGIDYVCRLVQDRNIIECYKGANLVATVLLD